MARKPRVTDADIVRDRLIGKPYAQIAKDRRITIDKVMDAIGRFADVKASGELRRNLIETALLRLEMCARTVMADALAGKRDAQAHLMRLERAKCNIAGIFAAPGQLTVINVGDQAPAPGHTYDELRAALAVFEDNADAPTDGTRH